MKDKSDALPNRATVLFFLADLISQRRSGEEVASWASQFIRGGYDHVQIEDPPAREMLSILA